MTIQQALSNPHEKQVVEIIDNHEKELSVEQIALVIETGDVKQLPTPQKDLEKILSIQKHVFSTGTSQN